MMDTSVMLLSITNSNRERIIDWLTMSVGKIACPFALETRLPITSSSQKGRDCCDGLPTRIRRPPKKREQKRERTPHHASEAKCIHAFTNPSPPSIHAGEGLYFARPPSVSVSTHECVRVSLFSRLLDGRLCALGWSC